jgi:hypothetical protein
MILSRVEYIPMENAKPHTHLPDFERMSLLMALILLTFTLAQILNLPGGELSIQLPGLYLKLQLGSRELVGLLVALIAAAGTDWVLQIHPHYKVTSRLDHWLLPAITSWAISMPIFQIPIGPIWWLAFILGSLLLTLVLLSEYFVIDPTDLRYPLATAVLTSVSYALYLLIAAALQHSGLRLILVLPGLALSVFLISLRILRLRPESKWAIPEAAITTFLIIQIASPLHYLPISPISYGLAILGPAYATTIFFTGLGEERSARGAIREPLTILVLVWISAVLLR